jgi:MFS family permease
MKAGRSSLGREFNWLWSAFAVSSLGTGLAFGAFPLVVILVLHGGSGEVSALSAAGQAAGAVVAIPLAPWIEFRRKRPVMVAMDLTRFAVLLTVPLAFALGHLTFAQLVVVSVFVEAADITFRSASGACMKALVRPGDLLAANGWFESTNWTSIVLGPPLGGLLIGAFGPVTTVVADAVSFLLSACGIRVIGGHEPRPAHAAAADDAAANADANAVRSSGLGRVSELFEGWRFILRSPSLRPLFFNAIMVSGLIMATEPLLAVLMLGRLGFAPWQYGLAFSVPCIGGLVASRFARRIGARYGQRKVILFTGALRAVWPIGLVAMRPGVAGLAVVMGVELGLIVSCGIFNPVYATYRLQQTPNDRVSRVLSAWSVSSNASIAVLTALLGVLAQFTTPLTGIGVAGLCLLASPFLLPWHRVVRGEHLVGEAGGADRLPVMRRQPDDELVGE